MALGTFLANVISGWEVQDNQSSGTESSDLQVAKLNSSSFSMKHKMGLLTSPISTTNTEVDDVITYNGNSESGGTGWTYSSSKLYYQPSRSFSSSNVPYINNNTLYYIGRPSANNITFTATAVESGSPRLYSWQLTSNTASSTIVGSSSSSKSLTIPAYSGKTFRKKVWEFSYSGEGKQWVVPVAGTYTIECWGASGGNAKITLNATTGAWVSSVGCGGYVSGSITLSNQTLFVYAGQQGNAYDHYSSSYMFNGGGYANKLSGGQCGSCGGGATDIRTTNGTWSTANSLNSRIMIAAGGGGCSGTAYQGYTYGSCAGGLNGYNGYGVYASYDTNQGKGASQSGGGAAGTKFEQSQAGTSGSLGKGGIGGTSDGVGTAVGGGSGGGGGLYGGGGSSGLHNGTWSGGGGSSYISGHSGCTAKTLTFSGTKMVDGAGYNWTNTKGSQIGFPAADGTGTTNGHIGNGFARITYMNPTQ